MTRNIIILAALALGACTTEVVSEEESATIHHRDEATYIGSDEVELGELGGARTLMRMGFGAPDTREESPDGPRQGPFPDPWQQPMGPFPDPWQDNGHPKPGDKP